MSVWIAGILAYGAAIVFIAGGICRVYGHLGRRTGPRCATGWGVRIAGLALAAGVGYIVLWHLRYFLLPVPTWVEVLAPGAALAGVIVLAAAGFLLLCRRSGDPILHALVLLAAATGIAARHSGSLDLIAVKDSALALSRLRPVPPPLDPVFLIHCVLALGLIAYFPFRRSARHGVGPEKPDPQQRRSRRRCGWLRLSGPGKQGILWLAVLALVCVCGCDRPAKPTRDGKGPYSLYVDASLTAPRFHQPLDQWRHGHRQAVRRGERSRYQCVLCHAPERHCNQCHRYIGLWREVYSMPAVTLTPAPAATTTAAPDAGEGAKP